MYFNKYLIPPKAKDAHFRSVRSGRIAYHEKYPSQNETDRK